MGKGCITCDECGAIGPDATDDGDALCDDCAQNRAEAAWERLCEDGPGPTLLEQQIAAMRFK